MGPSAALPNLRQDASPRASGALSHRDPLRVLPAAGRHGAGGTGGFCPKCGSVMIVPRPKGQDLHATRCSATNAGDETISVSAVWLRCTCLGVRMPGPVRRTGGAGSSGQVGLHPRPRQTRRRRRPRCTAGSRRLAQLLLDDASQVTDRGVQPIVGPAPPGAPRIRGAPIGDQGIQSLAGLTSLRILNLPDARFSDAGLAALRRLPRLELLRFHSPR